MDPAQIEQLLSSSNSNANPINDMLQSMMPILSLLFIVSIILTVVIIIFLIVNTIQKQRQHSAIMRIDKNLQRLVDAKFGATAKASASAPQEPERKQAEEAA